VSAYFQAVVFGRMKRLRDCTDRLAAAYGLGDLLERQAWDLDTKSVGGHFAAFTRAVLGQGALFPGLRRRRV